MENKSFFQKIKEALSNIFKGKPKMEALPESTNQVTNVQNDESIDKSLDDRTTTEEKSFRESLKIEPNSFENLEPESVQKKILALLGVNPELINSPIVRDTVFEDFISKIKDNPMEVYNYFKENCTVNPNRFSISIKNESVHSNTSYNFMLEDDNLKMFKNITFISHNPIINYDIHSIFDKNGLELNHREECYLMSSNDTKTVTKTVSYKYELARESIDKAKYVDLLTNQTETLDLIAEPSWWDIAMLNIDKKRDSKTGQILVTNIYEEPKKRYKKSESGNIIITSGQTIRNRAIKQAIESSKYKQACLSYIKENDLNLYNEIDSKEQNSI